MNWNKCSSWHTRNLQSNDRFHQRQTIGVWFSFIVHSWYNDRFMFPSSFSLQTLGTLVFHMSCTYTNDQKYILISFSRSISTSVFSYHQSKFKRKILDLPQTSGQPTRTTSRSTRSRHLNVWCILGKLQANPWLIASQITFKDDLGVSKNRGTPKWMVYNGNPYQNGWFGGTTIFRKHPFLYFSFSQGGIRMIS